MQNGTLLTLLPGGNVPQASDPPVELMQDTQAQLEALATTFPDDDNVGRLASVLAKLLELRLLDA